MRGALICEGAVACAVPGLYTFSPSNHTRWLSHGCFFQVRKSRHREFRICSRSGAVGAQIKPQVSIPGALFSSAVPFCLFRKGNLEGTGTAPVISLNIDITIDSEEGKRRRALLVCDALPSVFHGSRREPAKHGTEK